MHAAWSGEGRRGQVLVLVALLLVILLAFAGLAIDVGRQVAERRHVQNAADAAALAACRGLINGESDSAAAADARSTAQVNLQGSPSAGLASIAPDASRVYADGHAGDPAYLLSGIIVSGASVRVAIRSTLPATLGHVVGVTSLDTGARARCSLEGGPALPIVARRYINAPGPGGGFIDTLATSETSGNGQVDPSNVLGYDVRTPASEVDPGPTFQIYGPDSKASNDSSFRGFVALDVRNFQSSTSRIYYNGATAGMSVNTLKSKEGAYITDGYLGPAFPPITQPADPNDQVAVLDGNDTSMVVGNFSSRYAVGDRLLLGLYNGTVMQIPDFSITPPSVISIGGSQTITGPTFVVSRNDAFNSTVTLHLHGDDNAPNPAYDLIPEPPSTNPPTAGHMNMPTWSTDVFIPDKNGTRVTMNNLTANAVPTGIYTVWLEGHSGNPYFQSRRYPVPVNVGNVQRDFSLGNSTLSGSTPNLGGAISLPIYISTANGAKAWGSAAPATQVALSVDTASFTDCSYNPAAIGSGQLTLSPSAVWPTSSGSGTLSTLSINTVGLAAGCYRFDLRATGTNADAQPVTHLAEVTFTVATQASGGSYVDLIGFAVFQVTALDANSISARAVTGVFADSADPNLRRAMQARLIPW
jgi:Putative Flp pilus-assembly TadE/G-like